MWQQARLAVLPNVIKQCFPVSLIHPFRLLQVKVFSLQKCDRSNARVVDFQLNVISQQRFSSQTFESLPGQGPMQSRMDVGGGRGGLSTPWILNFVFSM